MKNKLFMLLVIFAIIFTIGSEEVLAAGKLVTPNIDITRNSNNNEEFLFEFEYTLDSVKSGDYFIF